MRPAGRWPEVGLPAACAWLGGRWATELVDLTADPAALDSTGFWAVVATFEGELTCARFARTRPAPTPPPGRWPAVPRAAWRSSLDAGGYRAAVTAVRRAIAAGEVYQVNVCRVLSAPLPPTPVSAAGRLAGLAGLLAGGNPAPYAGFVAVPQRDLAVVSASPELFLRRDGATVRSGPIKGTAPTAAGLLPKDTAENVMIVDLVRNDLGRVCQPGSVGVPDLCRVEEHPGLVHLVSVVEGRLRPGVGWAGLFEASFPPGSVSGAPKSSALRLLAALEPVPRGPYCGAVGWVDADAARGVLAVGIRSFWLTGAAGGAAGEVHFGTGAGITWDSDPAAEWQETELKAARLLGLAGRATG